MAAERLFVDTWGWLVLANDRDPAFKAVYEVRTRSLGKIGAWVATDYILDETTTRLFAGTPLPRARQFVEGIFEASREGLLDIEHVTPERFAEAWRLHLRYRDKPRISFTDFTSFAIMHELEIHQVLTEDTHFEHVGMGFLRTP